MKNLILTFALSIMTLFTFGQNAINYQGVCSTTSGVLKNQTIAVSIDITQYGDTVYSEKHLVETNDNGLFSLKIGKGIPTYQTFDMINFASPTFMSIGVDTTGNGISYVHMGTSQFLSVPNALYSQRAGEVLTKEIADSNYTLTYNTVTVGTDNFTNINISLEEDIENILLSKHVQAFIYDESGDFLIKAQITYEAQYSNPSNPSNPSINQCSIDSAIDPEASKFVFYFETINGLQKITHHQ